MANQTTIGELSINLKMKLEGLEKGLETAKKKLQSIEQQNEQLKNSNSQLDANFIAMSASIVASLAKIKSAIDDGVNKYTKYTNSMNALQKTARATNNSMAEITDSMEDVNEFKFIDDADLSKSMQNLIKYGFSVKQATEMLKIMQDTAVGNKQEAYSLSEAIRITTEGIRMENSVLSDASGIQKNISVMYKEYAESVGKSTEELTQAEKVQAVYNGYLEEGKDFIGTASEMANSYQGVQAQANASTLELSRTLGETMIPTLTQINSLGLSFTQTLNKIIENNKGLTAGTITFIATLGATVLGITTIIKVMQTYKMAIDTLNISTKTLKTTMASAFTVSAVLSGIVAITTAINEQKQAQQELSEAQEFHNEVLSKTIELNNENVNSIETRKREMEDYLKTLQDYKDNQAAMRYAETMLEDMELSEETTEKLKKMIEDCTDENITLGITLAETSKKFKEIFKIEKEGLVTGEDLNKHIEIYTNRINEANAKQKIKSAMDTKTVQSQQQEVAQLKINAQTMQDYLNIVKSGNKNTTEYQNAEKKLAEAYSECSTASGINTELAQDYINAEQAKADQAWNTSQEIIKGNIDIINTYIAMADAAEGDTTKQAELANTIGVSYENIIPTLTSILNILNLIGGYKPEEVPNITPTSVSAPKKSSGGSKGGSKSYSNKALDEYKKQIEHKKALDQISLQEEINMYHYALKKYAKTQDEKWELTEKIYSLQKELQEKSLDDYTEVIEHRKNLDQISLQEEINMYQYAYNALAKTTEQKQELEEKLHELRKELAQKNKELLDQQTTDYERYIQDQKNLRGSEYDTKEQEEDLNKIIKLHKSYLNQIMKDERLSLDERKELYQEELDTIRDYEQQKRDLRVQSVDDTVSQLTSAITKQLEEMEEADKKAIEENIKLVEEWKETRINAINEEYEARIEAIQKELDLLDKTEEEKTRAEEDAEFERKRNRLQQLVDFEHDATTKANYQKELDKLIADYQKTLDKRALQDKKETLKEQQDLLKEEQDNKVQAIEDEAEKKKEQYDKQLDELEEYYEKQKELAQETAEKMLLNVEQNQNEILKLLNSYGNAYEITGQTLGEKLAQGINNGIADKIQNIIQKVQDTIDAGIENKIKEWTAGMYKYEAKGVGNTIINKTVNVEQNNTITTPVDSPSVAYKKQETLNRNLANEIAYVF